MHFRRTRYKRGGGKASARLAYITREGEDAYQAGGRQLDYIANTAREDLVVSGSRNLPDWAQGNPYTFFQAAEQYERANGVAFEEWKMTLPQELTLGQNTTLMEDLVTAIAGHSLPITYAFHNPSTTDGTKEQPHLHLLISARINDGISRPPGQYFRRYNDNHPERGGAQKSPLMNTYHATKGHRMLIADVLNLHLEANGQVARIHPDRLEERGIARKPEPKLDPAESAAYRKNGAVSPRMQQVLTTRAERNRIAEQNQARTWWEERKDELGIDRAMAMEEKLTRVVEARGAAVHGPPVRPPEEAVQHEQQAILRAIAREHLATGRGRQRERVRDTRHAPVQQRSLTAALEALRRSLEQTEEHGSGRRLRVRLHDEEISY